MNRSSLKSKTLRRCAFVICASTLFAAAAVADEGKQFKALLHDKGTYGSDDVAAGRYEQGIEKLSTRVGSDRIAHSKRVPALIDLCAAYTMTRDLVKAKETCDKAVDSGWYSGHAYNNRGAYNIAVGDYEAAIRDFQAAIAGRGADRVARTNLQFAEERLVAKRESEESFRVIARNVDGTGPAN
ncbi:MAG: tetratricopeptide repeat protein [Gammaproteobacteria bacterium]